VVLLGFTIAYLLACENIPVIVLEGKAIGNAESGRSTAHLSNGFDDHYQVIEQLHGITTACSVANSHTQAIDWVEKIVAQEQMDCGFERLDGYLWIDPGTSPQFLQQELVATHRAGLNKVSWLAYTPIPSLQEKPFLHLTAPGQVNPVKYLIQLAQAIIKKRGKIFTTTPVKHIQSGKYCVISTHVGYQVKANYGVMATNKPINDRVMIHARQTCLSDLCYWCTHSQRIC